MKKIKLSEGERAIAYMETTVVIVTVIFISWFPLWIAFYGVTAFKQAQAVYTKKSKFENLVELCHLY